MKEIANAMKQAKGCVLTYFICAYAFYKNSAAEVTVLKHCMTVSLWLSQIFQILIKNTC